MSIDGCVWDPEMYELWGGGGAPFKQNKDGTLTDKAGRLLSISNIHLGNINNSSGVYIFLKNHILSPFENYFFAQKLDSLRVC